MTKYLWKPLLTKYGSFKGRACRKEYFSIIFFCFGMAYAITILIGVSSSVEQAQRAASHLPFIFQLVFGIPIISAGVRRLHDTHRSGWWFWIKLVPVIGLIWYIVLMFLKGTKGDNRFGPDPSAPPEKNLYDKYKSFAA